GGKGTGSRKCKQRVVEEIAAVHHQDYLTPKAPTPTAYPPPPTIKLMAKLTGATTIPDRKTLSGIPIEPVYGPEHVRGLAIPAPGEFPYTRGIHETMYRGKLWTMRQFSGFATPEETNRRFLYLLSQGQ